MLNISKLRNFYVNFVRQYETVSSKKLPRTFYDVNWPKNKKPTPYEVFGLNSTNKDFNAKKLKKIYHKMVKVYHPDISQNITILNAPLSDKHHVSELKSSLILSKKEKSTRFKLIKDAYELLNDTHKRAMYDRYKTGWTYDGYAMTHSTMKMDYDTYHSNFAYYNAGTWEDVNNLNSNGVHKEKISPWVVFVWFMVLFCCVEFTAFLTRLEDTLTRVNFSHDKTEQDLTQAYINYGLATDKWSRLRRFLWFRTFGLYKSKEDLDREAKLNEQIVQDLKVKHDHTDSSVMLEG